MSSGVIRLSIGFVKERVKLAAPEPMCLERAALAKEEMEHGLMGSPRMERTQEFS